MYEIKSVNNGNLDIVDRSTGVARLILDPIGNMGLAMTPTGGGNNGLFIGNGAGPTIIPAAGGALYASAGRLFYRGSAGTVTLLAKNLLSISRHHRGVVCRAPAAEA